MISSKAEAGRMLEWGTRTGVVGRLLYDGDARLVGISDRSHDQVIWYEYSSGQLTEVRGAANRRVTYG